MDILIYLLFNSCSVVVICLGRVRNRMAIMKGFELNV